MKMNKLILTAALGLAPLAAFATNGDNMIAVDAVSRAMGGVGQAYSLGPASALKNPALIHTESKFEFTFAATRFSPDVTAQNGTNATVSSSADEFYIPAIAFSWMIADNLTFGLGAYGVSGLGVDYRSPEGRSATTGVFGMRSAFSIMKFAPTLAYKMNNFKFGAGLGIYYGQFDFAWTDNTPGDHATSTKSTGAGTSDDVAIGFHLGTSYDWNNLTLGLSYKSAVEMEYDHVLTEAGTSFGFAALNSNKLEQPAEIGAGFAYKWNNLDVTFDYTMVKWSDAKNYGDAFGWDDQNVMAFGLAYHLGKTTLRAGYNKADTPFTDKANKNPTTSATTQAANIFNVIGFPAIIQTHITFGLSHEFSKTFSMDLAYVIASEETEKGSFNGGAGAVEYTTVHSQSSATLGGNWKF